MYKITRILFLLIIIPGCSNSDDSPIQVNLVLRNTFSQESNSFIQGEAIGILLTTTNTTNEPITLNFTSSQQYDFCIETTSGAEVWR